MIDEKKLHMQYLGVLGLMCEASQYVPAEIRKNMETALREAVDLYPTLSYRLVRGVMRDRLEIEVGELGG